ncbi:MAG: D-2-hydroxyacid dehydrogenase [Rhodospirillaceae bacterium]|nr:D-2-hydroxyacid dehydrogenase [Rhodospirillaceae bacterium]MBT4671543.1 D-2-hydroxyacid dehydrogenase [Rhodospirillaceae bacterium]MBT4719216.1 D-2-hydroxyacid dehydrogenase [Rhodospirillaceae bacterium]MBT5178421.1 D-2-hydroxyacid dehydrogenase [Rhodospirillaceae bacterium]MBT5838299.1 D-2-hydroxyacid dehydrogenase [Rhodospirillaceae bacterium]
MTKVLLVDSEFEKYRSYLEPNFPDVDFTFAENGDGVEPLLDGAEVLISFARWLTADMTADMGSLKWLQCMIAGTEHLKPSLAARPDVLLTNGRGIHGPQMAEMTLFHMLALYRQVRRLAKNQAGHVYERFLPKVLDTRKVAILGLGAIAEHMSRVFSSLGMTVYGISRTERAVEGIDKIFSRDNMAEAVADVDFLVVLLPFSPETEKIVGAETFAAMKPSACLINVARGGVVDEAALIEALNSGAIAGAGLDVYEKDPLPTESPLWDMENVFMTPFIGGRSDLYAERILTVIEPNLRAYLDGNLDKMINIVD